MSMYIWCVSVTYTMLLAKGDITEETQNRSDDPQPQPGQTMMDRHDHDDGAIAGLATPTSNAEAVVVVESLTLAVLWLLSLVGNVLVCVVVHRSRRIQSTTNYFVVSLAVSDLCLAALCAPFVAARLIADSWEAGQFFCKVTRFAQHAAPSATTFVLVSICVDRYYTIIYPLSFKVTRETAKRMIICSWVSASLLSVLCFFFFNVVETTSRSGDSGGGSREGDSFGAGGGGEGGGGGARGSSQNTLSSPFTAYSTSSSPPSSSLSLTSLSPPATPPSSQSPAPPSPSAGFDRQESVTVCPTFVPAAGSWGGMTYIVVLSVCQYVLPALISCVLYARVAGHIWTAGPLGVRVFQRTSNPVPRTKVKMVKMLLVVTAASLAMQAPLYLTQLAYCFNPGRFMDKQVFVFAFLCLSASGTSKPFLYFYYNTNFRRGCKEVFCMSAMRCYRSHTYAITTASMFGKKNHVGVMEVTSNGQGLAGDSPVKAFNRSMHVGKSAWPLNGSLPSTSQTGLHRSEDHTLEIPLEITSDHAFNGGNSTDTLVHSTVEY